MGNNVDVVHLDSSNYVAMADARSLRGHNGIARLSGHDLTDFNLLVTKEGFVPISSKPIMNCLNIIM